MTSLSRCLVYICYIYKLGEATHKGTLRLKYILSLLWLDAVKGVGSLAVGLIGSST